MDIKIGKYVLKNDDRQYTLSEMKISKGEKTAGEEIISNITYHPSITSALEALLERKIKTSDATTLSEIKKDFSEAVVWIKDQFKTES